MEFKSIKGFRDILPGEIELWQRLEAKAREVLRTFGFKEIRTPILEWTELFSRSIGQDTDIVSKEMYSLSDSKGRGLTMRPEATASVVRAYIQHRLYQGNPVQKLFTIGPMFRHERPQKGRFRQFHQINAEIIGDPGPKSDADLIVMAMTIIEAFGLTGMSLRLNTLGCPGCRKEFKILLKKYLEEKGKGLCSDCTRRAESNPLRVFDCKVEGCREIVSDAPSILDHICGQCRQHFDSLQGYLSSYEVPFILDPKLVRGLDYYTRTTFEIQTPRLGAQNAVTGGGRYDGLVSQLGGPEHPALGFAMGMERLVELLQDGASQEQDRPDIFLVGLGEHCELQVFKWANDLRKRGFWVEIEYGARGLKAQMKRADRLGARKVLIVGEEELASGKGVFRDMATGEQGEVSLENVVSDLAEILSRKSKP
ncbi:MAG: histidine--tRNA ligase [Deltaproteobacteria bacterium]|nr:histidine--tRNA ligase [Deltaproteobacteria bacterium]